MPRSDDPSPVQLVEPSLERLTDYIVALEAGWSPSTTRDVCAEQLAAIADDPAEFVRDLARHQGGTVPLPDGTRAPRLPGRVFWIWDGGFCGSINLRFVPGQEELPAHVSGHVGYAVVPWRRNRGYARDALRQLLPVARGLGLRQVLITCDVDNAASRRVIEANGGVAAGSGELHGVPKLTFWVSSG